LGSKVLFFDYSFAIFTGNGSHEPNLTLSNYVGWDLTTLETLPFMTWVRRLEIDFLRPVRGDQEITITSYVREFRGPDALIECTMIDSAGQSVSRCLMTVAHVDKVTNRATDWPSDLMVVFFEEETV
jgi:acyl-CoA thioester hydrolase